MRRGAPLAAAAAALLALAAAGASAQATAGASTPAKKELVQRLLVMQQAEIETVTRNVVERPAMQMMQEAALAMQRQIPPEKREAMGKLIEAEAKKYIDEAYPLARATAMKVAPLTIGATLEEKMSEEELRQVVTWLESAAAKKFAQLGPDMRNAFIRRLVTDAQPLVDPKVQALDAKVRSILGVAPAPPATPAATGGPRPPGPGPRAASK